MGLFTFLGNIDSLCVIYEITIIKLNVVEKISED